MMTDNPRIYILTVSKSLLIVLGTSPKSAVFWSMESAALWKTKARLPQGLDNPIGLTTLPTAPMMTASFSWNISNAYLLPNSERAWIIYAHSASIFLCSAHPSHGSAPHVRAVLRRATPCL